MLLNAAAGHRQRERLRHADDTVDDDIGAAAEGACEEIGQPSAGGQPRDAFAVDRKDAVADAQTLVA